MPAPLTGGRVQRLVLDLVPLLGLTDESLVAYLSQLGMNVDRSLVSRWRSGDRAMPVDVLVALAQHADHRDHHDGPERVLGVVASLVRCTVVRLPDVAVSAAGVVRQALQIGAMVGDLQREVYDALADQELDEAERLRVVRSLDGIITDATRLRAQLQQGAQAPGRS